MAPTVKSSGVGTLGNCTLKLASFVLIEKLRSFGEGFWSLRCWNMNALQRLSITICSSAVGFQNLSVMFTWTSPLVTALHVSEAVIIAAMIINNLICSMPQTLWLVIERGRALGKTAAGNRSLRYKPRGRLGDPRPAELLRTAHRGLGRTNGINPKGHHEFYATRWIGCSQGHNGRRPRDDAR